MPCYSYYCADCKLVSEVVSSIREYREKIKCPDCKKVIGRDYEDMISINSSVRKSDSELKTLGDLARRNSERMSDDEKNHLQAKHNSYRQEEPETELPSGMTRMKKHNIKK